MSVDLPSSHRLEQTGLTWQQRVFARIAKDDHIICVHVAHPVPLMCWISVEQRVLDLALSVYYVVVDGVVGRVDGAEVAHC
jgi:hypothetical protein